MAGGFGMYARNFLAGQGRYIPDTQEKAPAASEGEDGAVCPACKMPRRDAGLRPIEMCACATLTYTRPAAQAAFTEADGVALRSIKVGEVLTQEQWDSVCAFVREGEAVLDARNDRIAELESELAAREALRGQMNGLLNTCVDVIEEGLCASQSYDYRARAQRCAQQIKEVLTEENKS